MNIKDLEVLNQMPFFFWVKDEEGRYLWANTALTEFAGVEVVGKTDYELPWSINADHFRAVDKQIFETGNTLFLQEVLNKFVAEKATLSICKFIGKLDGKKCCFGTSYIIRE